MYQFLTWTFSLLCGLALVVLYKKYCSDDREDLLIIWILAAGVTLFLLLIFLV